MSLSMWFILLMIVLIIYYFSKSRVEISKQVKAFNNEAALSTKVEWEMVEDPIKVDEVKVEPVKIELVKVIAPERPSWYVKTSADEMTGKVSAYAHSPTIAPIKDMSFPHDGVKSWMGVGCDSESEWAYFGFSTSPNIANSDTKDGYSVFSTRIKWDDKIEGVRLTQDWGAKFIHFSDDISAISNVALSSDVRLELKWHGQQAVFFDHTLHGSAKALNEIRNICSKGS